MIVPRDYQAEAVHAVRTHFVNQNICRQLGVLPTASGKTIIFSYILMARKSNGPGLVIAHTDELLGQARDKILRVWPQARIGLVKAENNDWQDKDVVVASIQTLSKDKRLQQFSSEFFATIIVDECHHAVASSYIKALDHLAPRGSKILVVGWTATANRGDKSSLRKVFDKMVFYRSVDQMVQAGWLVPPISQYVNINADFGKLKTTAGDFNKQEMADELNTEENNKDIVRAWWRYAWTQGRKCTICFTVDVKHAYALHLWFTRCPGVVAEVIHGDSPDRKEILERFKLGQINVLLNCLDEQTEILTRRGWAGIDDFKDTDMTAVWDQETDKITWEPVTNIVRRKVQPGERMVTVRNQSLDIRVTEGHSMRVGTRSGDSPIWKSVKAGSLPEQTNPYYFPLSGYAEPEQIKMPEVKRPSSSINRQISALSYYYRKQGNSKDKAKELATKAVMDRINFNYTSSDQLSLDDCRFIGLFITDGHFDNSEGYRGITIGQSWVYPQHHQEIKRILESCGFDYTYNESDNIKSSYKQGRYCIPIGSIGGKLKRAGFKRLLPYLDKDGSELLFNLCRQQVQALIEGIHLGDGSKHYHEYGANPRKNPGWEISKTNKVLFDKLQILLILRGFRASMSGPRIQLNGTKPIYTLYISDKQYQLTNNASVPTSGGNPAIFEDFILEERVWCVTNQTHTIITRRNGKVVIMGQCMVLTEGFDHEAVDCILIARPTVSQGLYMQMIGRGLRPILGPDGRADFNAKPNCLVLDTVGNSVNHKLVTMPMVYGGQDYKPNTTKARDVAKQSKPRKISLKLYGDSRQVGGSGFTMFPWLELSSEDIVLSFPFKHPFALRVCFNFEVNQWQYQHFYYQGMQPYVQVKASYDNAASAIIQAEADAVVIARDPKKLANDAYWRKKKVSEKQKETLAKLKITLEDINSLTIGEVSDIITSHVMNHAILRLN